MREITKSIKRKEKNIKISLKKENEILKEMCKYLFTLINSSGDMFFYYSKHIKQLEEKIKRLQR